MCIICDDLLSVANICEQFGYHNLKARTAEVLHDFNGIICEHPDCEEVLIQMGYAKAKYKNN